jgi:hypothetical protein
MDMPVGRLFIVNILVASCISFVACNMGPGADTEETVELNTMEENRDINQSKGDLNTKKPPECSGVCGPSANCNKVCWVGRTTTCGDSGYGCYVPPPCYTRRIQIRKKQIGVFEESGFLWCKNVAAFEHEFKVQRICDGSVVETWYETDCKSETIFKKYFFHLNCCYHPSIGPLCWGRRC